MQASRVPAPTGRRVCRRCGETVRSITATHCDEPTVELQARRAKGSGAAHRWLLSLAKTDAWTGVDATSAVVTQLTSAFPGRFVTGSSVAKRAQRDVLRMLNRYGGVAGVDVSTAPALGQQQQYISHPWRAHASVMVSLSAFRKNLANRADLEAVDGDGGEFVDDAAELLPHVCGLAVDEVLKQCSASATFKRKGLGVWDNASRGVTSVPAIGLQRVEGCADAVFDGVLVELKTIDAVSCDNLPRLVDKVSTALPQVALYQTMQPLPRRAPPAGATPDGGDDSGGGGKCVEASDGVGDTAANPLLTSPSPALLVLVGRGDHRVCVLEVDVANVSAASAMWAGWLTQDRDLPAIVRLMNGYADPVAPLPFLDVVRDGCVYQRCCDRARCKHIDAGLRCARLDAGRPCRYCHCNNTFVLPPYLAARPTTPGSGGGDADRTATCSGVASRRAPSLDADAVVFNHARLKGGVWTCGGGGVSGALDGSNHDSDHDSDGVAWRYLQLKARRPGLRLPAGLDSDVYSDSDSDSADDDAYNSDGYGDSGRDYSAVMSASAACVTVDVDGTDSGDDDEDWGSGVDSEALDDSYLDGDDKQAPWV